MTIPPCLQTRAGRIESVTIGWMLRGNQLKGRENVLPQKEGAHALAPL